MKCAAASPAVTSARTGTRSGRWYLTSVWMNWTKLSTGLYRNPSSPDKPLALTRTISEREVGTRLRRMRRRNRVFTSMIGMGYHDTIMPAVIKRNVLENPAWYTAYTPYQAEISQGRLEALLNFQQMITDLTGMEIANASMLDEATAAAEAMSMAKRLAKKNSNLFFVDRDCHPQTISVVRTRANWFGYEICVGDPFTDLEGKDVFGALFQYPGSSGELTDLREPIELPTGREPWSRLPPISLPWCY